MERNANDAQADATLFEFSCSISTANFSDVREERPTLRQASQNCRNLISKMDDGEAACLFPGIGDGVILPVDILGVQIGDIGLRTAQVPAKPVEVPALRILLARHYALML